MREQMGTDFLYFCVLKSIVMKILEKKIRILVCLSVGVLGILAFLIICADGRYRVYKETLGEALTATLLQEMDARNTEAVNISMQYTEERKLQDTVRGSIKSAEGMWYFAVPREKYLYNVGKDPISRDMHSYFMLDTGLKVDSLYLRWCQLLSEESVDCRRLGLRLKSKLPETAAYYPDSVSLLHADSLCTRYAGAYCEVEVVAFSDISRYGLLRWTDWMLMVLAGVCWVALCRCHVFLKRLYQSLFVHRGVQTVIKPVVVERPVVVEKVVFGVGGLSDGSRVYKLDEGVFSIRYAMNCIVPMVWSGC